MTQSVKLSSLMAIIIVAIMFVAGCGGSSSSLNQAINQVEKALEKVEKNKGNMTEADWNNLEKEVEEPLRIIGEAFENNLFKMTDRIKVAALTAKWAAVVMEAGFLEMERQTGINREELGTEFGVELEKASEELQKAAEEIRRALQGIQ